MHVFSVSAHLHNICTPTHRHTHMHACSLPYIYIPHGAFMRALAESLRSRDILVTFGKMADHSFMHCASLTILLERFDSYHKIVLIFGLLVRSGCALSRFKTSSFAKCLQITCISHDIARLPGKPQEFTPSVTFCLVKTNPDMSHMRVAMCEIWGRV